MKLPRHSGSVFSRPKVQKQLVTIFIIVLIIPVSMCCFLLYQSGASLYQHYREQTEADNLRIKSIMFDVTMNLYNVSEALSSDSELTDLLYTHYRNEEEAKEAIDSYQGIYDIMYKDTSISSVDIYTFNDTLGEYSYFHPASEEIQMSSWFTRASVTASAFWQTHCRCDQQKNAYWELVLYRKIPLVKTGDYAVLAISVSDNYLKNRIDTTAYNAVITVNQDPVFYSSPKTFLGCSLPIEIDYTEAYYSNSGPLLLNGRKTMSAVSTLVPLNSEDKIYLVSCDPDALDTIYSLIRNYLLILCITILLPCVLFYIYSRYFSSRVLMLRKAMYQASRGNYDIMDSFTGNDEISETFHDLRTMIKEIKAKEAQIYQARIKEQEIQNRQQQMEFKMLASQINPHFLYNTLETIRMKAFTVGAREVATAIKLLGKSLRYVLENTGTVSIPLSKEIDYIHTYVSIQKLRFGERINYQETIAEGLDLDEYKVLPLLLQPIVENSISHGLRDLEEGGLVSLEICETDDQLCIRIMDNGKGMTQEELRAVLLEISTLDETRIKSIGLYNINHRLQLCYGSDYRLQMESIPYSQTITTLKLPLAKIKEESANESSYR